MCRKKKSTVHRTHVGKRNKQHKWWRTRVSFAGNANVSLCVSCLSFLALSLKTQLVYIGTQADFVGGKVPKASRAMSSQVTSHGVGKSARAIWLNAALAEACAPQHWKHISTQEEAYIWMNGCYVHSPRADKRVSQQWSSPDHTNGGNRSYLTEWL